MRPSPASLIGMLGILSKAALAKRAKANISMKEFGEGYQEMSYLHRRSWPRAEHKKLQGRPGSSRVDFILRERVTKKILERYPELKPVVKRNPGIF
jgi:hypothetical protein